jgi:hypothetical protein
MLLIIQVRNALTNCVIRKKYIKSLGPRFSTPNIDSYADCAMKITAITTFANSANKYTPIRVQLQLK